MPLRLFHKEIEANLCAEGLFDDDTTEDGIVSSSLSIVICKIYCQHWDVVVYCIPLFDSSS